MRAFCELLNMSQNIFVFKFEIANFAEWCVCTDYKHFFFVIIGHWEYNKLFFYVITFYRLSFNG